jgi:hypothetical protein
MHVVDLLPLVIIGGVFVLVAYKIASEVVSARRAS